VIEALTERLAARRIVVVYCHWRPRVVGRGAEPGGGPVSDPHGKPPRGRLASVLKLVLLAADWHVGGLWKLRHARAKAKLVLFDRYYDDLLIDPRRYRYGGSAAGAGRVFRWLPRMDRVFVLWAPAAVIAKRKQEVAEEELARQLEAYRTHALGLGARGHLIPVDRSVEAIVDEVAESLFAIIRQHGND
jgi:thymidylate kinase